MSMRAVHLDTAYGLDTDSLLNAFYRFVNHHGYPEQITITDEILLELFTMELFMSCKIVAKNDQQKVVKSTSSHGLMCNLNLPNAPHFGRVFEVMIKAAKRATSAILGTADVTDEELSCAFDKCPVSSAFIGAEAVLNLTQLTYRSASPNDITPVIPSHFLHGELGSSTVPPVPTDSVRHPKQHWRCVQELIRHFWHHWIQQWLRSLASRKKMETVESKFRCR